MKKRFFFILLFMGGVILSTFSQEKTNEKVRTIELNPVVVTATGTHQRLKNSPAPVSVITANDIRKTGIVDFQQALNQLVPSLSFSTNAMGSYLTMNGLSNKYVLILINGRKLIGDVADNIDISRINMSRVRRIEVLSGAASSLYGSDAIAGVINIIMNEPKETVEVTSNSRYEEYGQFSQMIHADIATKKFGSYTSYKYETSDGWQQSDVAYVSSKKEKLETVPTIAKAIFGHQLHLVGQKFTYAPTENLSLYANGGFSWKLTDRPVFSKEIEGGSNYNLQYESYRFGVGGRYKLNKQSSISLDVTGDDYRQSYKYLVDSKSNKVGDLSKTKYQQFYNADLKGIFKLSENSQTVAGLDYRTERLDRPSANVDRSVFTASAYAQHEVTMWKSLKAIAGVRYDYHETAKGRLSPKLALKYAHGPFNVRGTYAAGYRAPGLNELYYYMAKSSAITKGNVTLKPEYSNYLSLNAEYITKRFNLSVTGYLNYVDDMIAVKTEKLADLPKEEVKKLKEEVQRDFDLTNQEMKKFKNYRQYRNLERGIVRGIEVNGAADLGAGFSLMSNYSFVVARGKDLGGEWDNLERSIRHTGTLSGNYAHTWNHYRLNVNLNARFQSRRFHPGNIYGDSPGYGLWNLNTTHSFDGFRHLYIEPGIGINNIFDRVDRRPHGVIYSMLSPGRTFYVSLTLRAK